MQCFFTREPLPQLLISGSELAQNGFLPGTLLRLLVRGGSVKITPVTDEKEWEALCEVSQNDISQGADVVLDNGDIVLGGTWLSDLDISHRQHVEIQCKHGLIILARDQEKMTLLA